MTQGVHTNQLTKHEHQGVKGIKAIADHVGIDESVLISRMKYKDRTLEQAIAMGPVRPRKQKKSKRFADCGIKFIKRGNRKRLVSPPNLTELQKLALGIASHSEMAI